MAAHADDTDLGFRLMKLVARRDELEAAAADLADRQQLVEQDITATVHQMREAGATWQRVGLALGVTRLAAEQRYGGTTPDTVTVRITEPMSASREAAAASKKVLTACDNYWERGGPQVATVDGVTTLVIRADGRTAVADAIAVARRIAAPGWSAEIVGLIE